ncbi:hypothetical protein HW132_35200 [Brasilonema sp. CT11]|nr:hypothetical protein [Brasilonema sp. CT11]
MRNLSSIVRDLESKKKNCADSALDTEVNLKLFQEQSMHNSKFISSGWKLLKQLKTAKVGQTKQVEKRNEKKLEQEEEIEEDIQVQRHNYNY